MNNSKMFTESLLKNLLLNYGSHLTVSCDYVTPHVSKPFTVTSDTFLNFSELSVSEKVSVVDSRAESHSYGQKQIVNGVAHLILIINQLLSKKGKFLVVNCTERSARKLAENSEGRTKNTQKTQWSNIIQVEGGWINGSCSNLQAPQKTYTSREGNGVSAGKATHSLGKSRKTQSEFFGSKKFLQGNSAETFRKRRKISADCILLINPTSSAIKECQALDIPLCLLSTGFSFAAPHCHIESNQDSYFLIYLINCIINYYKSR